METTEERLAFVEEQWDRLALWAYSKFKEVGRGAVRVWLSERRKVGDGYDYPVDYLAYWPEPSLVLIQTGHRIKKL